MTLFMKFFTAQIFKKNQGRQVLFDYGIKIQGYEVEINKKGEGRFSFTFLRREISPAKLTQLSLPYAKYMFKLNKIQQRTCHNPMNFIHITIFTNAFCLSWLTTLQLFPGTFHQEHSNLPGIQLHIEVLHENPGILYIY